MRSRPGVRGGRAVAATACAVLALGGCSGDDDPSATADPEPSAPSVPVASSPAASSSPPVASATPTPSGPAPATGRELRGDRVSVRAPEGWEVTESEVNPYVVRARDPESLSSVVLSDVPAEGERTLDGEAADALDFHGSDVERVADVVWGGLPAYRVQGESGVMRLVEVGTLHAGGDVMVQFELSPLQEPADQRRVVESVLASVEWR